MRIFVVFLGLVAIAVVAAQVSEVAAQLVKAGDMIAAVQR